MPTPDAAVPAGAYRPTDAEWSSLTVTPVREMIFRPEEETDGRIAANDDMTTPVFSPYSGRVTKLFAKAGDQVTAGAPLASVAATEVAQGQNDLIAAADAVKAAQAQLQLAETSERRQHALYEAKGAALKDWQQSQADLASAQSNFRSAAIALVAARNRLRISGKSDKDIDAMERAPDLQRTGAEGIIRAPIGGTILLRQIGLGQYINSASNGASTPVFSIGDLSTVWLVANVREADAPQVRLGEPVEAHVLAFPTRVFRARITYVAPSIDADTHRLPVRAEIENPDGVLKPEMFARFTIITGEPTPAPAIPEQAIIYEGDEAHVWVVGDDKTLTLREIHGGSTDNGMVQVLGGLKTGEKVVTAGSLFIDRAVKGD